MQAGARSGDSELDREAAEFSGWLWRTIRIGGPPIDIAHVARACGVQLATRILPCGLLAMSEGSRRIIVLNRRRTRAERRFDFGHELAELLNLELIGLHDSWPNMFAGHLTVPLEDLARFLSVPRGMEDLEARYGVTRAVLKYQIEKLRAQDALCL